MKNLLTIVALTALTSTAWAINDEGDAYTGAHNKMVPAHPIEMVNNELDGGKLISIQGESEDVAKLSKYRHDNSHVGSE